MDNRFWGFPAAARAGRWTALLEPIRTRSMRLHLLRRSHNSEGNAVHKKIGDQNVVERVVDYAVRFELVELPEGGDLPIDATVRGDWESGEVRDFLQAIVDCADQLGIVPSKQKDLSGELDVTRAHLEDFRRLVFKDKHQPLPALRR